jgi:A/G-specific adenine glycosylase
VQRRTLPWREAPALYKTVVSEFMLQQTQVKTVLPYFARWLAALPDFAALAAAPESPGAETLGGPRLLFSRPQSAQARPGRRRPARPAARRRGLARTARGRPLHRRGNHEHFAFGAPAACVDGNVVRILARLTADGTAFRDSATAAKALTPLAEAILTRDNPGDHNQAMMELGATVCSRHNPLCASCPVRTCCAGQKSGTPEQFPKLAAKKIEQIEVTRVWCLRAGQLLMHRTDARARRLAQQHELPTPEQAGRKETTVMRGKLLAKKKRSITKYRITESIYLVTAHPSRSRPGLVWVPLNKLDDHTLSGPHRRWIGEILKNSKT